jgi:polar amino acid transport system substrate-binding protein
MFTKVLAITLLVSIQLFSTIGTVFAAEEPESIAINITTNDGKIAQLQLVSDDNPPYAYTNSDGNIVGTLVDKLSAVMKALDISYQFQILPWKRALSNVQYKSNTLIFPLSRTPEREDNYSWIIPLHNLKFKIYGLKGTFNEGLIDITKGNYTFVCAEDTILCSVLRQLGVPESSIVKFGHIDHTQMIKMVFRQRVNFLLISDNGFDYYPNLMNFNKSLLAPLKNYNFEVVEYLAGSNDFDPLLIKKIQAAFRPFVHHVVGREY